MSNLNAPVSGSNRSAALSEWPKGLQEEIDAYIKTRVSKRIRAIAITLGIVNLGALLAAFAYVYKNLNDGVNSAVTVAKDTAAGAVGPAVSKEIDARINAELAQAKTRLAILEEQTKGMSESSREVFARVITIRSKTDDQFDKSEQLNVELAKLQVEKEKLGVFIEALSVASKQPAISQLLSDLKEAESLEKIMASVHAAAITEWRAGTFVTSWATHVDATGYWRRVGNSVEMKVRVVPKLDSVAMASAHDDRLLIDLPAGLKPVFDPRPFAEESYDVGTVQYISADPLLTGRSWMVKGFTGGKVGEENVATWCIEPYLANRERPGNVRQAYLKDFVAGKLGTFTAHQCCFEFEVNFQVEPMAPTEVPPDANG